MHSIFLSYSFQNDHEPLLKAVRAIIEAVGFRVIDGRILETNHVGPGVTDKLKKCYGAVCVMTKAAHQSGWVDAEFWQAVGADMHVAILCDDSLQLNNAYVGRSKFPFSDEDSLTALSFLAGTLGKWKEQAGSHARVLLLPQEVATEAIDFNAVCEYRCIDDISAEETDWEKAKLVPYVAGVQAILPKVMDNHSVKVRLTFPQKIVNSKYTPQQITLTMK